MAWPHAIFMKNSTNRHMEAYNVVTNPPPPHREHDPSLDIPPQTQGTIDPNGFNVVYYVPSIQSPNKPNGLFVGFALDDDPALIQYKVMRYQVAPGQEGNDPAKQPSVVAQGIVEVTWNADTLILLDKDNLVNHHGGTARIAVARGGHDRVSL